MGRIREQWNTLTPEHQRLVSVGGVLILLVMVLYGFVTAGPDTRDRAAPSVAPMDKNLLTGSDPKSLGLDALGNDLRESQAAIEELEGQLAHQSELRQKDRAELLQQFSRLNDQLDRLRAETASKLGGFSRSQQDAFDELRREVQTIEEFSVPVPDTPKPGTFAADEMVEQGLFEQPTAVPTSVSPSGSQASSAAVLKVRVFGEEEPPTRSALNDPETVYLPAGAIISGVLINGVDAPTGNRSKRHPRPALVRVKHSAILPNRFRADIRECHIIVATTGDLSTVRAYMRGESLSCVRNDGRPIEIDIDAYVVGEDGKPGMRGRLVSRDGAVVAKGAAAGFAQALSDIFRPVRVQSVNTRPTEDELFIAPDAGQAAEAGSYAGFGGAMGRLADQYIDLADQIVPFVEVDAGRSVDVILLAGASLTIRVNGD